MKNKTFIYSKVLHWFLPNLERLMTTSKSDDIIFRGKSLKMILLEIVLCDDYSHKIAAGVNFLKDNFLEK